MGREKMEARVVGMMTRKKKKTSETMGPNWRMKKTVCVLQKGLEEKEARPQAPTPPYLFPPLDNGSA